MDDHVSKIDQQTEKMLYRLVSQMAKREGITEQLKASNQMAWVQAMNSTSQSAEEIVNNEIILA